MYVYFLFVCVCDLHLGEHLERGIKNSLILLADEAVVLTAQEEFEDTLPNGKPFSFCCVELIAFEVCVCLKGKKIQRTSGDKWMITGPAEYIPRIEIGGIEHRCAHDVSCSLIVYFVSL